MKKLYCISYDLSKEGDYALLVEEIKKFGIWWHQSGSVWYIASEKSSIELRDILKTFLKPGDKLFVIRINSREWAATGFSQDEYDWLKKWMDFLQIN